MEQQAYRVWAAFYERFADKLYLYRNNRQELISKIKAVYDKIGMKLPTLDKDGIVVDLDPFTIFGMFNKGITTENRIKIITGMAQEFGVTAEIPKEFDGVPVVNPQLATFYYFYNERHENDIDHLWDVFCAAVDLSVNATDNNKEQFIRAFDTALKQKGIKWNLTMGLFWIRPFRYINLDSRSRWFIMRDGSMPKSFTSTLKNLAEVPSGEEYLSIIEQAKEVLESGEYPYRNFPEFSMQAWVVSQKDNQENGRHGEKLHKTASGEAVADQDVETVHYWMYAPGENASMWDQFYQEGIMGIGWSAIGDLTQYHSKNDMREAMKQHIDETLSFKQSAYATWQFAYELKPGDIVFAKRGTHTIIGKGVVTSDYRFEQDREDGYKNVRSVQWMDKGTYPHPGNATVKTLTDITEYTEYVQKLLRLFEDESTARSETKETVLTPYNEDDFLEDVFIDQEAYETLVHLLKRKKNIILQGAPGVGKTYAAKRLAYSMMGVKDPERVAMVQFHQSYSYEDFIMGFRPTESGGFEIKKGPFYHFCKKAEEDSENDYFFIIDEINRGNLSKIFGELFMLLESDKRGIPIQMLYENEMFNIPGNVHVIGMMNTADRSLAMLDYALRRRFAFFELSPAFQNEKFRQYQSSKENEKFDRLIQAVEQLNVDIEEDDTLGRGFRIGHSYFCTKEEVDDIWLDSVVRYELIPLLEEYWFDDPEKIRKWRGILEEAIR